MSATASVDVEGYLLSKGLVLKRAGAAEVHTNCFYCGEDAQKRGRLYINIDPNADIPGLYKCFLCDAHGALVSIKKFFGDATSEREDNTLVRRDILREAARYYHDRLADKLDVLRWLKEERGLTIETIVSHELGWADGGLFHHLRDKGFKTADVLATGLVVERGDRVQDFLHDNVTIPYHVAGSVVLIRGKEIGGKYLTPPGAKTRLFNSDVIWDAEEVSVCEGEFDAMVLGQLGYKAVGAPGANVWQDSWDGYFTQVRRAYILFDPDGPGKAGAEKLRERLSPRSRIVNLPVPDGVQPSDVDPTYLIVQRKMPAEEFAALYARAGGSLLVTVDEAYRDHQELMSATGVQLGVDYLDSILHPGLLPGQVMVILAKTGCLAADTMISVNRAGKGFRIPISKMYERWSGSKYAWDRSTPTYVQRADTDDGVVRLGLVDEVWESGEKDTYTLRTLAGREIRATAEHPFLTPKGWRKLAELSVGDEVLVSGGRSRKGRTEKQNYQYRSGLVFHPYANRRKVQNGGTSVPLHRLVFEANYNDIELDEFIRLCREGPVDGLVFFDPAEWVVHHRDHDAHNNYIGNLEMLTSAQHAARHADEGAGRNVLEQVVPDVVSSIEYFGREMTYDISVVDEPHNFMANGFAVHNTGKTIFLLNLFHRMAAKQPKLKILFVSLEQTRAEWFERARRIHRFYDLDVEDKDTLDFWRPRLLIVDKNRVSPQTFVGLLDEYAYEMGSGPDIVAVDYLGYWAQSFKGERYERTSDAVMAIKEIAKDYGTRMIVPHQVSRGTSQGSKPSIDAARDAGVVEETADFLLTLWNPDSQYNKNKKERQSVVNCGVEKSRHGGVGAEQPFRFAPLTLAMVPQDTDSSAAAKNPLCERALREVDYAFPDDNKKRLTWEEAIAHHQLGSPRLQI